MTEWDKYVKVAFLNGPTFKWSGKYSHGLVVLARVKLASLNIRIITCMGFLFLI